MRRAVTDEEVRAKSEAIMKKLLIQPSFQKADCIFAYMDFNHEVMTGALIESCWKMGKRVAVPRTAGDTMEFYEIHDFSTIAPGTFGVPEPQHQDICMEEGALLLIPGVGFDTQRHRIGYGKGFYDRYQSLHPHHPTIAVAFDFQVFEQVPFDALDVTPQCLITETTIYTDR